MAGEIASVQWCITGRPRGRVGLFVGVPHTGSGVDQINWDKNRQCTCQ